MPTYSLICQGNCNPHIGAVDRLRDIAAEARLRHEDVDYVGNEDLWREQATLVHTDHYPHNMEAHVYICAECGVTRKWGH